MKWREKEVEELVGKREKKSGDRVDHSLGESEEMWKEN